MELNERIEELEGRVAALEKAVSTKLSPVAVETETTSQKGPSVGLKALASNGFFENKHDLGEVREALAALGYFYSRQAVHIALKRFSQRDGSLIALFESGRRWYARRK